MAQIERTIRPDRNKTKEAAQWLYSMVGRKLKRGGIPDTAFNPKRDKVFIGGMFVYEYDPKLKEKLPWYDTLPVIIPIEMYHDGWLGLNLHYLPPAWRKALMDKLLEFKKRALTPRAYMALSYEMLSAAAKTKGFEKCIHRYLASQLRSPILRIDDQYWEKVAMLPIQQFHKATAQQVWGSK